MKAPEVFYNQEDLWTRATEKYYEEVQPVEPYDVMWKPPGEGRPEFTLFLPFTPKNRQVLIGWIAGMSDGDDYGRMLAYKFPKETRVLGTQQMDTKIDQDPVLSAQLSLWSQRGQKVIRGNALVIPVEDALLYVEPIFLQADTAAYPELRHRRARRGQRALLLRHCLAWVGLRGAVPIILAAFPILANAPRAHRIFNVVFFVVVVSGLAQGASTRAVTRWLGLEAAGPPPPPASVDITSAEPLVGEPAALHVGPRSPARGRSIAALGLPRGALAILVVRGRETIAPKGDLVLEAGDYVDVFCHPQELPAVEGLFSGAPRS